MCTTEEADNDGFETGDSRDSLADVKGSLGPGTDVMLAFSRLALCVSTVSAEPDRWKRNIPFNRFPMVFLDLLLVDILERQIGRAHV